jgi:D-sedoheptulose 7-phosphate isomerase
MVESQQYVQSYMQVLAFLDLGVIENMSAMLIDAWRRRRTVFVCGNGGSAASACHFAADLTKLTAPDRGPRLRSVSLAESLSAISAIGNDLAYEEIFAEQLRGSLQEGDVVLGLSTSGSSKNVLRALEYANDNGGVTLGITGRRGKSLQQRARTTLTVASESVQHIEDATMVAAHLLCLRVAAGIKTHEGSAGVERPSSGPVHLVARAANS